MSSILLWLVAFLLIILGLVGTVLPALPGTPLVYLGLLLVAWSEGFARVGALTMVVLAILMALTFAVDLAVVALGAKRINASRQAVVGAFLGTLIGLFSGFAGLVIAPFLGAAIGEFIARREVYRAGRVGLATWIALVIGTIFKLGLTLLMVGIFVMAYLWK